MLMEEFLVLLDEHRAMQVCVAALRDAIKDPIAPENIALLLQPLAWMASFVHAPKETGCVLHRLPGESRTNPLLAGLLEERAALNARLDDLWSCSRGICDEPRTSSVNALNVLERFARVMELEERLLYPAVYNECSNDDLWDISVELDRAVDKGGRLERDAFIRRHIMTLSARKTSPLTTMSRVR